MKDYMIGSVHLPALLGYEDFPGLDVAYKNALADIKAFEEGGFDAVIIENNYDLPHVEFVPKSVVASMAILIDRLKKETSLDVGISVLWNDHETALSIAKLLDLDFIRIPVFVDTVKTDYGIISGNPEGVNEYREKIGAENVKIFTDIHVKHAELVSGYSFVESAKLAEESGSDGLIVTGKWTGDPPLEKDFVELKNSGIQLPLIVGSGMNKDNVQNLMSVASGAIVSTSLKQDIEYTHDVNVKGYEVRVVEEKVREMVDILNNQK
jgi:membrane complex biogenesis BtpA family protein